MVDAFEPVDELVNEAEGPIRAKLFTDDARKKMQQADKPKSDARKIEYGKEATEIAEVTDHEDGRKLVETSQVAWYVGEVWDAEAEEMVTKRQEDKIRMRFTCSKAESGDWQIDRVERWQFSKKASKGGARRISDWVAVPTALHNVTPRETPPDPEPLKQDTPENAAHSLFDHLLRQRTIWKHELRSRALRGWIDALVPMFSEEGLKDPIEEELAQLKKKAGDQPAREIEFTSDGVDGIKRVKFKRGDGWMGSVEVHLKQEDEVWKVIKAGYYRVEIDRETGVPTEARFVEEYNLELLDWR